MGHFDRYVFRKKVSQLMGNIDKSVPIIVTEKIGVNPQKFITTHIFTNLNLFHSQTDNLIQWLPVQSYWQARNINNVERYGFTGNWVFNSSFFFSLSIISKVDNSMIGTDLGHSPLIGPSDTSIPLFSERTDSIFDRNLSTWLIVCLLIKKAISIPSISKAKLRNSH